MLRSSVLVALLAGCWTTSANVPTATATAPGCEPSDIGKPSLFTLPADAVISRPRTCAASGPHEAYIHIAGTGSRQFSVAEPGKATGCTRPGPDCTTVDLGAFLQTVTDQLKARGLNLVSWGIAECGRGHDPHPARWDDQHLSIIIHHWRSANEAVSIVAAQLRAWDVGQSLEVAVAPIACAVDMLATERDPR